MDVRRRNWAVAWRGSTAAEDFVFASEDSNRRSATLAMCLGKDDVTVMPHAYEAGIPSAAGLPAKLTGTND
jgi:hypothetical protein